MARARVKSARAQITSWRSYAAGGAVAIFAHGHILRVIAARWLRMDPLPALASPSPPERIRDGHEHENEALISWNVVCGARRRPATALSWAFSVR